MMFHESHHVTFEFTTDPNRRSFLTVDSDSHFPIQNLPYGVFRRKGDLQARCGVAIGDMILDLTALESRGLLPTIDKQPVFVETFNGFAGLGKSAWRLVRSAVSELLDADNATIRDDSDLRTAVLHRQSDVQMLLPMAIGDYTDFYSSKEHATNVGIMFRGIDNALQPNWLHIPVAYHGRASSIVVSGIDIQRPNGQQMPPGAETPVFGLSKAMDFELEMGFLTGSETSLGSSVTTTSAEDHIFGMVLLNDWSARDIQRWEYVPLGPFLGKNFATSISPWVVSLDALEPFRCTGPQQDPTPLPYLRSSSPAAFDIQLEVSLSSRKLSEPAVISRSNFRYLYWSMQQQLAHHTCNGCNIRPGDLLGSGTISGPTPDSYGSMLELAWKGERPLKLPNGETRKMLLDGDTVAMAGWAQGEGYRVGFGDVTGEIHG
jgi:fumarylacetoacetase